MREELNLTSVGVGVVVSAGVVVSVAVDVVSVAVEVVSVGVVSG